MTKLIWHPELKQKLKITRQDNSKNYKRIPLEGTTLAIGKNNFKTLPFSAKLMVRAFISGVNVEFILHAFRDEFPTEIQTIYQAKRKLKSWSSYLLLEISSTRLVRHTRRKCEPKGGFDCEIELDRQVKIRILDGQSMSLATLREMMLVILKTNSTNGHIVPSANEYNGQWGQRFCDRFGYTRMMITTKRGNGYQMPQIEYPWEKFEQRIDWAYEKFHKCLDSDDFSLHSDRNDNIIDDSDAERNATTIPSGSKRKKPTCNNVMVAWHSRNVDKHVDDSVRHNHSVGSQAVARPTSLAVTSSSSRAVASSPSRAVESPPLRTVASSPPRAVSSPPLRTVASPPTSSPLGNSARNHLATPLNLLSAKLQQESDTLYWDDIGKLPFTDFLANVVAVFASVDKTKSQYLAKYADTIAEFEQTIPNTKILHLFSFDNARQLTKKATKFAIFFQAVLTTIAKTDDVDIAFVTAVKPQSSMFWSVTATMFSCFDCNITPDCLCENTITFMTKNPFALSCVVDNGHYTSLIELFRLESPAWVQALFPGGVPNRSEVIRESVQWKILIATYNMHCQNLRIGVWDPPAMQCVWCAMTYVANCTYRVICHDVLHGIVDHTFHNIFQSETEVGHMTVAVSLNLGRCCVGVIHTKLLLERYVLNVDFETATGPAKHDSDCFDECSVYCSEPL
jgi:hypothetical protein